VFFCKYNDPIYVKMEKLEIMIKLANEKNIDQVLLEFKEYAQEVDVDFVRKVRAWLGCGRGGGEGWVHAHHAMHIMPCTSCHAQKLVACKRAVRCTCAAPRPATPPHQNATTTGGARHRPLRREPGQGSAALHRCAAGAHPDQGQLRGAGGRDRHQGVCGYGVRAAAPARTGRGCGALPATPCACTRPPAAAPSRDAPLPHH
jgi:hypothetical protein